MRRTPKGASASVTSVLSIVPAINKRSQPSSDPRSASLTQACIDELRYLLKTADEGRLSGIAFAWIEPGGNYHVDTIGELDTSPTFAIGALEVLKANLLEKVME